MREFALLGGELSAEIAKAIESLPVQQREVIVRRQHICDKIHSNSSRKPMNLDMGVLIE